MMRALDCSCGVLLYTELLLLGTLACTIIFIYYIQLHVYAALHAGHLEIWLLLHMCL
jgi:hypothetical protein